MLAVQKTDPGKGITLTELNRMPAAAAGELLIKVAATGICGTDLHIDAWAPGFRLMAPLLPVTLGHEFSGEVVEIGDGVTGFTLGARVVVQPALSCGACAECLDGRHYDCPYRVGLGMQKNGGFASHAAVPAKHCLKLPPTIDAELGALIEPLTTSHHAATLAKIRPGDRVAVFGPGPIGQGAAIFARRMGAGEVTIIGHGDAARFETLRGLGFERLIDLAAPDGGTRLQAAGGTGFDAVIEASGAPPAINAGLGVLKPFGTMVLAGMPETAASLDVMLIVRGRHSLVGCSRAPDTAWHAVIAALVAAPEEFRPLITHRLPMAEAPRGFLLAHTRAASKVLLFP